MASTTREPSGRGLVSGVEAWVRVQGVGTPEVKNVRELFLSPQLLRLDLPGLHHVPEIADGDSPHAARGCPFQAYFPLGEVLRMEKFFKTAS